MTNWGYPDREDNARLDAVARRFLADLKKSRRGAEPAVRTFMRSYLKIGEDPTDTVIRDKVWTFLMRHAKRAEMPESVLDAIWREEVLRKRDSLCVIC